MNYQPLDNHYNIIYYLLDLPQYQARNSGTREIWATPYHIAGCFASGEEFSMGLEVKAIQGKLFEDNGRNKVVARSSA